MQCAIEQNAAFAVRAWHTRGGEHGYRDRPVTMRLVGKPGQPLALGRARRVPQAGRPE
jgi:hypothetical protein